MLSTRPLAAHPLWREWRSSTLPPLSAALCDPHPLFADEPTGNLDSATSTRIVDLLFTLHREQNTALVIVTHDEQLAHRCTRRLQLADGVLHG